MEFNELPADVQKTVTDILTVIELFGTKILDLKATLQTITIKAYKNGYSDGREYAEQNPPIRPNY